MLKKMKLIIDGVKNQGIAYIGFSINYLLDKMLVSVLSKCTKRQELENVIVIESHNDFDCNGGAFYRYLIEQGYNKTYKIVWLVMKKQRKTLLENVEQFLFYKPSLKKAHYLCKAKYLLYDNKVIRKVRADQKLIYCTHGGCTFKNVKGLIIVPDSVDYVLSASKNFDPYMCDNYMIPFPNDKMLHFGYPAHDVFFKAKKAPIALELEKYKKIILWMPTFRKTVNGRNDSLAELPFGVPVIQTKEQLEKLDTILKDNEALLIIKIHPMQDMRALKALKDKSNVLILDAQKTKDLELDIYDLMSRADALISDYSSSAYSYLMMNRPIGFSLSDVDSYKLGFSVENIEDFLPGEKIYTFEQFGKFVENVIQEKDVYKAEREKLLAWMYKYCDGNASKRLADFLKL